MAQIIEGGADLFDALAYGKPHPGTQQFLQTQIQNMSNVATEAGQRFYQNAVNLYDRFSGSTAMRYANAARRAIGSIWQSDEIRRLASTGDFQQAPLTMQRWIMAEPTVRRLYQQQRVEGYEGSYVDVHKGDIGEEHYDYRRVMQGIVHGEDTDEDWTATTYLDDLLPDDQELLLEEQVDILDSWTNIVAKIREGRSDPTSRWNADL